MKVSLSSTCLEIYEKMRKSKKYRYIIFQITSDLLIDIETVGPRDSDFKQFQEDLMRNGPTECRYGLFDLEYTRVCEVTKETRKREKLVLLSWCPSGAKPKVKILYLTYLYPFLNQLKGTQYYKTVRDIFELSQDDIEEYFH